jgi:cell division protein FtsQ
MKRIKHIIFFVAITAYLVIVIGFISDKEKLQHISTVKIKISDSTENEFVHARDILKLLEQHNMQLSGILSSAVNLESIEHSLLSNQIISEADAYITEPGVLHLDIRQKSPFVRICNRIGQGYYLDDKGNIIPLSSNFSPYVLIVNGNISEPFRVSQTLNIFNVRHDSLPPAQKTIYDVYHLVSFVHGDKFWDSQIEQIYVNSQYEFELIPRVGSQVIELGGVDNMEEKFDNLKLLYLKGLNKIGWNKYQRISLKYKNQVVCTKIQ